MYFKLFLTAASGKLYLGNSWRRQEDSEMRELIRNTVLICVMAVCVLTLELK